MTKITLFSLATLATGPQDSRSRSPETSTRLTRSRSQLGTDNWPLATQDAERLAAAGRRIEGRLDYASQHDEPVEEAPFFRRQLGNSDHAATFEIGIDASGPLAAVYLEWRGKRIVDSSGRLLRMLSTIAEATTTVRQAAASRRVQDLRIDPGNFSITVWVEWPMTNVVQLLPRTDDQPILSAHDLIAMALRAECRTCLAHRGADHPHGRTRSQNGRA